MQDSAAVELGAVSETLLWTLYHRAAEAGRRVHGALLPAATRLPWIRRLFLSVPRARFG